ncbi:MAG: hypothetical protein ACRCVW_02450 [Brevinema sp.]
MIEIYTDKGCKCKDSDPICTDMEYIVVDEESIKNIKEIHSQELHQLKIFGKIILGQNISDTLINNWAKVKHYYQHHISDLKTESFKIAKAKSILNSFSSSSKVGDDLKLTFSHSLHKLGAKTLLFDAGCADSKRILITSNSHSIFNDSGVQGNTKIKFIALLQNVFHDLGSKYNPVRLTSGFRTPQKQAEIMTELLIKGVNIAAYYLEATRSLPYLCILQSLYDDDYTSTSLSTIGAENLAKKTQFTELILDYIGFTETILDTMPNPSVPEKIILIAGQLYNRETIKKMFYKNSVAYYFLLEKGMNKQIFWPSRHLEGVAFDIELNTSGSEGKAYDLHRPITARRATKNGTNDHYHLTLK